MTEEKLIALIAAEVLRQLGRGDISAERPVPDAPAGRLAELDGCLPDLTTEESKAEITMSHVVNRSMLEQMRRRTPARLGLGSAGPRLRTQTYLTLRADHAGARDAVFRDVDAGLLQEMGLFTVQTLCANRGEYLTRPDLGRQLSEEVRRELRGKCQLRPQVQVYVADGLSSQAVEGNLRDILPALMDGLQDCGIATGTPFFLRFGRVPAMDVVSETLGAEVTCVLLGERPGLAAADSMSAYIAYKATVGMPEARRTVVSNIRAGGIPPAEAGAHISGLLKTILERKQSGVELQL